MSLSVRRNHDYTISVIDCRNREVSFRDIVGSDLEFLDKIIDAEEGKESLITLEQVVDILSMLCTKKADFKGLPQRTLLEIFEKIKENILCNYMSKHQWLRQCYGVQNGSFAGVLDMERVPMSMFIAMAHVHHDAIESMNKGS